MRNLSLATFGVCLASATLALAACGGGGNSDADQIAEQIDFAATSGDPAACTEAQTLKFTEQTTFETGDAAIASCKKNASDTSDSAEATDVVVDGDQATAKVAITGGGFDGQTLKLSLVKEGDSWKINSLDGFIDFDPVALGKAFAAQAVESGDLTQAQADCVANNFANGNPQAVEAAIVSGDASQLQPAFQGC